jgi:type II secretory pathway component PulF
MMKHGINHKAALEFTEMMETLLAAGLSLRDSLEMTAAAGAAGSGRRTRSAGGGRGGFAATGAAGGRGRRTGAGGRTAGSGRAQAREAGAAFAAREILAGIERGASFAEALCAAETVFPPVYRGMIAVGDRAGSVERIFPRLGAFLREQKLIREKTVAALAYPALVLFIALAGSIALAVFVLPRLESVFSAFGGDAGAAVRRNIAAIKTAGVRLGAGLAFSTVLLLTLKLLGSHREPSRWERAAELLDRAALAIPLAGSFIVSWETLNFSFAMEALTSGGISVEAGLWEAEAVLSNRHYRKALREAREAVMNGGSLSTAFSEAGVFPPYFCRWIAVGESSGKSEGAFTQIRTWFQGEIEKQTARFLLLIEPALIAIIGVLILILIMAVVLPLFQAYGTLL